MPRLILLLFLSFCSIPSFAKFNHNLTGTVVDEKNDGVPFATIALKKASDSSLVKVELSREDGTFTFEQIIAGKYFIEIQLIGFQHYVSPPININQEEENVKTGSHTLRSNATNLQAVNIVADKPFIERQIDKTVVNIENSTIHAGTSVSEVLEKLPGVLVNQDGVVSLKGKQGVIIMIDGKPTGLSAQDLGNLLKGISSSSIQKIEIITNPSSKYDASGNAGIINIIMKKNKQEGINGNVTAGYGQGRYEKYNGSLNLGYKNKLYNMFFNYGYAHRKGFNNLVLTRNFYSNDTINTTFDTRNYIIFPFNTHTSRIGSDFYLSSRSTVSVLASGILNFFEPSANNNTDILNRKNDRINNYVFTNNSHDKWYNYSFNTQFRHKIDTSGTEITTDVDYAKYWNKTDQLFQTSLYDDQQTKIAYSELIGDQDGQLEIYSAKADFVRPLNKTAKFEAGMKSSYVKANNDIQFFNSTNEVQSFDSSRSNHFIYDENINAVYANYMSEYKKGSVQFGLRTEHTHANGLQVITGQTFERDYIQLFPSVFSEYNVTETHSINANAARRIDRPAYQQMNPFKRMIDATTYSEGNPYLLPQITYNMEVGYTYNNTFFATVGYSLTHDNITDVLIQDSQKKLTIQSIVNIKQFDYYNLNIIYSKRLAKWWNTNTNFLAYYGIYKGVINNFNINQGTPSFYINTSNNFSLMEDLSMECNFYYNHKNLYGVTMMKSNYNLSLGLQKSLLKKQASLTLNVSDIFWKAYPSGVTHFGNVDEYWTSKRDTRVVNLNFSYRFGKGQTRVRKNTGADEEKRRAGNGA